MLKGGSHLYGKVIKMKFIVFVLLFFISTPELLPYTEIVKVVPTADVSSRGNIAVVADDILGSIIFNPACVSSVRTTSFLVSHYEYVENTKYESLILARPFKLFKLGLSSGYMYSENIPRTIIDLNQQFGYSLKGSYGNNWLTSAIIFAKQKENFMFGTSVRFIQENLAEYKTSFVGLNLGVLYMVTSNFSLGFVLDNLTSDIGEEKQTEEIPVVAKLGAKYVNEKFTIATELEYDSNQYYHFKVGSQIKLFSILTVNSGYDYHRSVEVLGWLSGLNLGCGIKFYNYKIDYAIGYLDKFGITHRITITGEIW